MPREMPAFTKAPPELVERFAAALDRLASPDVRRRQMFGYPCAFVGGNMATGLFADQWWIRVSEEERAALLELPGTRPLEVMPGRAMGRYVVLPPDLVADDARLDAWLTRALDHTRTLPAKS